MHARHYSLAAVVLALAASSAGFTSTARSAPIDLHVEVMTDAYMIAQSGPEPVQRYFPAPTPLPNGNASPTTSLWLAAETPAEYFSTPNWQADSSLEMNGNEITWTIQTRPGSSFLAPQVLTPFEHRTSLGLLSAGDYVLKTQWIDQNGAALQPGSITGWGETSFQVLAGTAASEATIPEPQAAVLMLLATALLASHRR